MLMAGGISQQSLNSLGANAYSRSKKSLYILHALACLYQIVPSTLCTSYVPIGIVVHSDFKLSPSMSGPKFKLGEN